MKAITKKEAQKIANKIGVSISEDDGKTFFATNEAESEVYEFDSKAKRDAGCALKVIGIWGLGKEQLLYNEEHEK